jgi:TIR domain
MARILLSYRRSDSSAMTRLIYDRLVSHYGEKSIFIDIDKIPFGVDFRAHIQTSLLESDVLLAVVGSNWTGVGSNGQQRITVEDDPVRVEIETALQNNITVVPVLIDRAVMPDVAKLPRTLATFPFLNGVPVDSGRDFTYHMDRLVRVIDEVLKAKGKLPQRRLNLSNSKLQLPNLLRSPFPWAIVGGTGLPFIGAFIGLSPPWPRGAAVITAIVTVIATILFFSLLKPVSFRSLNRAIVASALGLTTLASTYLVAVSLFTYQTPTTKEHWAKGYACSAEALVVYKDKCPNLGIDELREAEFEAERLWTAQSVTVVRLILVLLWLGAFVAVSAILGGLLAHRARARTEQG